MVDVAKAARHIAKLGALKFFPGDMDVRTAIVEMICGMVRSDEEVEWLCRRAIQVFNEWPGPQEIRALYCKKFRPADGIESWSAIYADGFPTEDELDHRRIEAPKVPALPPGHKVSADARLEEAVNLVAEQKSMSKFIGDFRTRRSASEVDSMLRDMFHEEKI